MLLFEAAGCQEGLLATTCCLHLCVLSETLSRLNGVMLINIDVEAWQSLDQTACKLSIILLLPLGTCTESIQPLLCTEQYVCRLGCCSIHCVLCSAKLV